MEDLKFLKIEIEKIKERNRRVETDKAWETSRTRKVFIAVSTYILVLIFLISIGNDRPFLNALVPSVAYLISTATLRILKSRWVEKRQRETGV